jgi:hypothetical protein
MQQQLNARMSVRESGQHVQRPAPVVRGVRGATGARGTTVLMGVGVTGVPGGADEVAEADDDDDDDDDGSGDDDGDDVDAAPAGAPPASHQARRDEQAGARAAPASWALPVPPFCHRVVVSGAVTQHLREFDGVTVSTREVRAPLSRSTSGASSATAASPGSRVVALRATCSSRRRRASAALTASQQLPSPSTMQPPAQARLQARSPQEMRYAPASSLLRLAEDDDAADGDEPGVTYAPSRPLDGAAARRPQSTPARGGYEARYSRLSPRRVVQGEAAATPPHYAARTVSFAAHVSPPRTTSPAGASPDEGGRPRSALRARSHAHPHAHAQAEPDTAELYPRNGSYASYAERYRLSRVHQMQPMLPLLP